MIIRVTRQQGMRLTPCLAIGLMLGVSSAGLADEPAADPATEPAPFTPGEISIGDPIPLPFAPPTQPPAVDVPAAATPIPGSAAAAAAPQGWLGLSIAESAVAGRWAVEEVVPGSPAAKAGILPGDEIRALGGVPLTSTDETAQLLTAITAGQDVKVSVARTDQVRDVVLTAVPRPKPTVRDWQSAGVPTSAEVPVPAAGAGSSTPPAARVPATTDATPRSVVNPFPTPGPAAAPAAATPTVTLPPAAAFATAPPATPAPAPLPTPRPAFERTESTAPSRSATAGGRGRTALGVRSVSIDPTTQARFGLADTRGAYVIGVVQDLPAARAGVPAGSVIVALDERAVASPDDLTSLVLASPVDRPVALQYVLPGGQKKRADVVLQSLSVPMERALVGERSAVPAPAVARRPTMATDDAPALAREIDLLRSQLESLERRLESLRTTQAAGR